MSLGDRPSGIGLSELLSKLSDFVVPLAELLAQFNFNASVGWNPPGTALSNQPTNYSTEECAEHKAQQEVMQRCHSIYEFRLTIYERNSGSRVNPIVNRKSQIQKCADLAGLMMVLFDIW